MNREMGGTQRGQKPWRERKPECRIIRWGQLVYKIDLLLQAQQCTGVKGNGGRERGNEGRVESDRG